MHFVVGTGAPYDGVPSPTCPLVPCLCAYEGLGYLNGMLPRKMSEWISQAG